MKKILYILLIGLFVSCDSLLDVEPETMITFDNYFKNEQDLESSLYQLQSFIHGWLLNRTTQEQAGWFMQEDYSSQNIWTPRSMFGLSGVGSMTTDWTENYYAVYEANVILDNVYKAEAQVSPERIEYYKAQAYFGRAVAYYFIARHWGEIPITRNSSSSEVYGKKPYLEVMDTVISDALKAYKKLPLYGEVVDRNGTIVTSKQFGTKGAACALLAHAYAWKGSLIDLMELDGNSRECYEKSIEYASYLINGEAGSYQLVESAEEMCQLFSDINRVNPESIWEITLDQTATYILTPYLIGARYIGYPLNPSVSASDMWRRSPTITLPMVRQLYDTLDTRRQANFYRYDYYSTDTVQYMYLDTVPAVRDSLQNVLRNRINSTTGGYVYPYKWRKGIYTKDANNPYARETLSAISTNYSYWRLSDIYLLRAECYVKIGENGPAEIDLNEIRGRRNVKPYPQSGGDEKGLKYAVFHERERELLMEGHRFYDIVRNGLEYINTYLPSAFRTLTLNDVKNGAIFYAISEAAFVQNDLLEQNTYWLQFKN